MSKRNKALWIAIICYGVSIISALLAAKYLFFGFLVLLLFPIGASNIKLLWLYSLPAVLTTSKEQTDEKV